MFDRKYPYTSMSEYNLDWIIKEIRKLHKDWSDFKILNTIHFAGFWDITKQYPAWTLVTDDNVGYISVQSVPSGVPIDSIDYWVPVYDYSTVIPEIMQRIVDLENYDSNLDTNVLPAITGDISDLQDDIDSINDILSATKRIILFGDSYANGWTVDGTFTPWSTRFKTYYESITGETISTYVYYYDGIGFINSNDGKTFDTLLTDASSGVTDHDTITDIIIGGGYNDNSYATADIITAVNSWVTRAKTIFPNATIYIAPIGYTQKEPERSRINERVIPAYSSCVNAVVMGSTVRILHYYPYLASDLMHPIQEGQNAIAHAMVSEMLGISYAPFNLYERTGKLATCSYTKNTASVNSNINAFTQFWNGTQIGLWTDLQSISPASGTWTLSGGEYLVLILDDSPLMGEFVNPDRTGFDAFGVAQTTTSKYTLARLRLYIKRDSGTNKLGLYCKAWALNESHTNYMSNVNSIFDIRFANCYIAETLC